MGRVRHNLIHYYALCTVGVLIGSSIALTGLAKNQHSNATVKLTQNSNSTPVSPITPLPDDALSTGEQGYLTIDSISSLHFKTTIQTGAQILHVQNKQTIIQISDRRVKKDGWSLTVKASGLQNAHHEVHSNLIWPTNGQLTTLPGNVSHPPVQVSPGKLINRQSNQLLRANPNTGVGTWVLTLPNDTAPIKLKLPAQQLFPGKYVGHLTWSLVSAPTN
ncbi:WxL domain-containing protein [Lactiplantibacillus plantarum]|nr:WxL domain-containing protein [Lactiplantibacillus plantarum]